MSVSQGDDALGTEQQVITPNRGHNGRCKYDSTAKSKAQNTTNHLSLNYTLQALVFIFPDNICILLVSLFLRNGHGAVGPGRRTDCTARTVWPGIFGMFDYF